MISVPITKSPYSCEAQKVSLDAKKSTLDYHLKNFGDKSKTNITAEALKKLQEEYTKDKDKFDNSDCAKDPYRNKCISLQSQIGSLRSNIYYTISTKDVKAVEVLKAKLEVLMKEYKLLNCDAKISEFRGEVVMSIADIYQQMDKERIEAENKYKVKQRVFFGAIVLAGAVLIITMFGKRQ